MKEIDPVALFRLSVLGPVVSRERLLRGELQQLIRELSLREYAIPGSQRRLLGEKTIQAWFYAWRREGIAGLTPKVRADLGQSKISPAIQEAVLAAKRENPRRSINQISRLLVAAGVVADQSLSRSAVHRLLQQNGLSQLTGSSSLPEEKRSFSAEFAGSIWYGDVMHGPRVAVKGQLRKTFWSVSSTTPRAWWRTARSVWARRRWTLKACSSKRSYAGVFPSKSLSTMERPTAPPPCRGCARVWAFI
jgi:putative transposase